MTRNQNFLEDIHDYLMKCDNQKLCRMLSKASHHLFDECDVFEVELKIKESFEESLKYNDELERSYLVDHIVTAIDINNEKVRPGSQVKLDPDGKFLLDINDIQNDFLKDILMNFDFMITKMPPVDIRNHFSDVDVVKEKSKLKDLNLSDGSSISLKSDGLYHRNKDGETNKLGKDSLERFKAIVANIASIQKLRDKGAEKTI